MIELDAEELAEVMDGIFEDERHTMECIQVAPTGPDQCAILFEMGDRSHDQAVSVVFLVDGFDPDSARIVLLLDGWLTSLSATSLDDLSALDVGQRIWRGAEGEDWSATEAAEWFNQRAWCYAPGVTFLIGEHGRSGRFDGSSSTEIVPARDALLYDIHGVSDEAIYCVGAGGILQRLRDNAWEPIDLALSHRLRGIDATRGPELLRFGGDGGKAYELRDEADLITLEAPDSFLFTVREFQGETYWGDSHYGVWKQKGTVLEPFFYTLMAYDLRVGGDFLYTPGTNMAWRFDGAQWKSLQLKYADGAFTLVGQTV